MIIFGAIDNYSRLPVSLECMSYNKAPAILSCFLKGVHTYGLPSRVSLDKVRENVLVLVIDYFIKGEVLGDVTSVHCSEPADKLHTKI